MQDHAKTPAGIGQGPSHVYKEGIYKYNLFDFYFHRLTVVGVNLILSGTLVCSDFVVVSAFLHILEDLLRCLRFLNRGNFLELAFLLRSTVNFIAGCF